MKKIHKPKLKSDAVATGIGLLGAGVVGAVGSIFGSSKAKKSSDYAAELAYQGQKETNETNLNIVRETNAKNLQLAEQQNQWNIEQWNRENQYNSPANQMKLYKQAGLNPNLAQGGFQPAGEIQSAPLANQVPAAVENPYKDAAAIKAQGGLVQAQYMKDMVSDAADTATKLLQLKKTSTDIDKVKADIKAVYKLNKKLDIETDILDKTKSEQINSIFLQNQKLLEDRKLVMQSCKTEEEKTKYQTLLNDMQDQNNKILHASAKWLMKEPEARVKNLISQALKASADGEYQRFLTKYAKENNRGLPTSSVDTLFQALADKLIPKLGGIGKIVDDPIGTLIDQSVDSAKKGIGKIYNLVDKAFAKLNQWAAGVFDE